MSQNECDLNSPGNICSFLEINVVFIVLYESEIMQMS